MWWHILVVFSLAGVASTQNCRGEESKERRYENICDRNGHCRVEPVLELAVQSQAVREVFPSWVSFEWITYDVTDCDAAYAVISAIDAYNDFAHLQWHGSPSSWETQEYLLSRQGDSPSTL
ncbi:unnamed protein product [Leptidea sinapis]|uniref:Uncharacterized protein n=1 Tax=Leptidea sinapis TaxID=189913 RepID=A0A5E4Q8Z5_9NEOP|nr:unnamed protein product [Leptidea sinapis]